MGNFIYIPKINPVKFLDANPVANPKYHTKYLDAVFFEDRALPWHQKEGHTQVWQTTDIINLQFSSNFDPIVVQLLDVYDNVLSSFVTVNQIPSRNNPGFFCYGASIALSGLTTGCYRLKLVLGAAGPLQEFAYSEYMYVSADPLLNTILLEYSHYRHHEDVMFETGVVFQYRTAGHVDKFLPGVSQDVYTDQRQNPTVLFARPFNTFEVFFNDEYGATDDEIDLVNRIFSCSSVSIDGKYFTAIEGGKMDFIEVDLARKRGVKMKLQESINRPSYIMGVDIDPNKKILATVNVDAHTFGDTSGSGAFNSVPVTQIL